MKGTVLVFSIVLSIFFGILQVNAGLQMEWGTLVASAGEFEKVNLTNKYNSPIIVVTPEYTTTTNPNGIVTWLANVTSTSFEVTAEDENFANVDDVTLHYIVMEEGNFTLPSSGIKIEAGSVSTSKSGSVGTTTWDCPSNGESVTFTNTFDSNPLVLSTRGSNNNPSSWAGTFTHGNPAYNTDVDADDMCIGLSVSKAVTPGIFNEDETIYWIAMDEGNGILNDVEYEIIWAVADTGPSGNDWINGFGDSPPYLQNWIRTWTTAPDIQVVGATSIRGSDGAWPVLYDTSSSTQLRMFVDEANERAHTGSESGGAFAFNVSGSYSENSPQVINATFNDTRIKPNDLVTLEVNISDLDGNNTVTFVNASIISPNGTEINYSLTQETVDRLENTSDLESGIEEVSLATSEITFGETGTLNFSGQEWKLVEFNNTYSIEPVVLAMAVTDNDGSENPYVPLIDLVNTTHMNISLCQDDGASSNCGSSYTEEMINYFVFDINTSNSQPWIEVGRTTANSNGASDAFTFNKTFSNIPAIFGNAQTYSMGPTGIGAHLWFDSITTSGAGVVACDHPGGNAGNVDSCAGNATETYGYVALDTANVEWTNFDSGSESIPNSDFTSITFAQTFNNPRLMVEVNEESGGQDGKYDWARFLTGTGADIRYCEHDGVGDCDTHNAEVSHWFAVEEGNISIELGSTEVNLTALSVNYENILDESADVVNQLRLFIDIDSYNNSASNFTGNRDPTLDIELRYNGGWHSLGNLSINSAGSYSTTITNSTVLSSWKTVSSRDVRITGIQLDTNGSLFDNITWSSLIVEFDFGQLQGVWRSVIDNTSESGNYTLEEVLVSDGTNSNTTTFNNTTFEVSSVPTIAQISPINNSKIITNGTVEFIWEIDDDTTTLSCSLFINGVLNQTTSCSKGINNSLNVTLDNGFYNWSVNVTDVDGLSANTQTRNFTLIKGYHFKVEKEISSTNTNQYIVNVTVRNLISNQSENDFTLVDFVEDKYINGSFNSLPDFTKDSYGPSYNGSIVGWSNIIIENSNFKSRSYSILSVNDYNLEDVYIIGLE